MRSRTIIVLAAFVLGLSVAASRADPTTYAGKLGASDIVVELTDNAAGSGEPPAGRYFYRAKGGDIPLLPVSRRTGRLELSEEEPSDAEKCPDGKAAPIAATWQLAVSKDGSKLTGTWKGKKSFAIELTKVGSRPVIDQEPRAPYDLLTFSDQLEYDLTLPVTQSAAPYDFLKVDVAMTPGETTEWGDATSQQVSDPRTKFGYPRIVALAEGIDPAKANATLQDKHWRYNISALGCIGLQYSGFHEPDVSRGSEGGDLGGFDDMSVGVTWLSPKLMSWTESGSVYCGGAHPENFSNSLTMDIAAGEMISAVDMLADWYEDGPGEKLVAFVKDHRTKAESQSDKDFEAECGIDDLIAQNLAIRFVRDGSDMQLVFSLENLPHAIGACEEDLLEMPLAEALPLLTPRAIALLPKMSKAK